MDDSSLLFIRRYTYLILPPPYVPLSVPSSVPPLPPCRAVLRCPLPSHHLPRHFQPTISTSAGKAGIAANGSKRGSGSSSPSSTALSPYSSPLSSPTSTGRDYGSAGGSWPAEDDFGVVKLTPDGVWRSISLEVFQRFRHRLELWGAEGEGDSVSGMNGCRGGCLFPRGLHAVQSRMGEAGTNRLSCRSTLPSCFFFFFFLSLDSVAYPRWPPSSTSSS